jgi:hypothetical protein
MQPESGVGSQPERQLQLTGAGIDCPELPEVLPIEPPPPPLSSKKPPPPPVLLMETLRATAAKALRTPAQLSAGS